MSEAEQISSGLTAGLTDNHAFLEQSLRAIDYRIRAGGSCYSEWWAYNRFMTKKELNDCVDLGAHKVDIYTFLLFVREALNDDLFEERSKHVAG